MAAAPDNPVYVQLGYGWAMLTPKAPEKLKIASDADLPGRGWKAGEGFRTASQRAA